ncbi:uncharacterized protein LOC121645071 isoform X2 [Melanotaenia boesemani]|uniref:uncharacterized protein LOC121645071 isoform X2 n=1 Tax=Melanotaenia boesemani TaxID=1250792 RepID=UPI001C03C978|nr:uncharacterized protein LOC121645071 isoform X2 [Melanotaenia boesemani]
MEEAAVQQEKIEGSQERRDDGGKADWKNECSLSTILKHSCFLCWSSPRDTDIMETDDRVLAKAAEIRVRRPQHLALELENMVAVESLELQEQESDRKELEETLDKLEKHKEKLVQQIKTTRQLCYEESQQILSLQAEEAQKESQVEEYERELARARWRLRKLREEVKQAKRKVEEAGERNTPLQDSIRQSYEEILQEENTLCSLSGGVVTPESQLEESASPADTTDDDLLPMRPWGRSQSLPAYADLIMGANGLSFCNNLAGTREEDDSGTSSPKDMERSDIEDDPEEDDIHNEGDIDRGQKETTLHPNPVSQLDFYQDNPFTHCQTDHDLFNEDLFPKTDSSDGFGSDPFKGSNPFAADMLFPEAEEGAGNPGDEADTSLSCAENKASTGTQCFESEFPDEDSDIEISYSREDLDAIALSHDSCGFKPIQSSSDELGPELMQGWRSQGQHSVESDPNGYELDLGTVSPPSDIEEQSLGSLTEETATTVTGLQQGLTSGSAPAIPEHKDRVLLEKGGVEPDLPHHLTSSKAAKWAGDRDEEPRNPATPQNSLDSQNLVVQPDSSQNSFELSYEPVSQSSCDPYGFKLSPEHSSHTLLDPDEAELSPEPAENVLSFDPEPSSSQPHELNFDPYGFDITASQMVRDSDPYGFKLSGEEENQEVLDLCGHHNFGVLGLCTSDKNDDAENSDYNKQEELKPHDYENQEVLEHFATNFQELVDCSNSENQEMLEPPDLGNRELVYKENQELLDFSSHDNQEMVEPCPDISRNEVFESSNYENQEVLEPYNHGYQELLDFSHHENQEVLDLDHHGNQELLDFYSKENQEVLTSDNHENQEQADLCSHDNQEVLDLLSKDSKPEANYHQHITEPDSSTNNSSDSDLASEDPEGPELRVAATTKTANPPSMAPSSISAIQDCNISTAPKCHSLLEDDLGSVFGAGGYVGCPDVADDLEPLVRRQENPIAEPLRPVRPVRPPRPSLKAKEKAVSQGIDLK